MNNDINKLIRHYVLEIVFTIVFVIISIPVWNMLNKGDYASIAKSYSTMDYLYLDIDKYIAKDGFADVVRISNDTNTKRGYNLIVKVNKKETNDDTTIVINGVKNKLSNLKYDEDKNYIYYSLAKGDLVANKEKLEIEYYDSELNSDDVTYKIIENHNV